MIRELAQSSTLHYYAALSLHMKHITGPTTDIVFDLAIAALEL